MRKERHEQEMQEKHNASVLQTIKELDQKIWKKYHPDYNGENEPSLQLAPIWLKTDVISVLMDFPGSEGDILSMIKNRHMLMKFSRSILLWKRSEDRLLSETILRRPLIQSNMDGSFPVILITPCRKKTCPILQNCIKLENAEEK